MNQKHAREARIINRMSGILAKKSELPVSADTGATLLGGGRGQRHKLPRNVKRYFAKLPHKEKGRLARYWRSGVALNLRKHGVVPKGDRIDLTVKHARRARRRIRQMLFGRKKRPQAPVAVST